MGVENQILEVFTKISGFLWGWPLLLPLLITGVLYTVSLKGIQFTGLVRALKLAFFEKTDKNSSGDGDISHFQALMTALSATVGTGNIAGVAGAVTIGGPGALFWMWVTGFLGMATKYAEALLGVHYRRKGRNGEHSGGPMYYIEYGLGKKWKPMAMFFAISLSITALGLGNMVQSNSIADVMESTFNVETWITGSIIFVFTGLVIIGGIKRIAEVASKLVPTMIVIYLAAGAWILITNSHLIGDVFTLVFDEAFASISALAGGVIGQMISKGVARGVFSNESGMGSAPIVAAAAKTDHPVTQALVSMTQTFIDTIVVCTFTGLIIIMMGLSGGEVLGGASTTAAAFNSGFGGVMFMGYALGELIVTITLIFFVFSTIIGWYYYGEKGITYIWNRKAVNIYKIVFLLCVVLGALMKLDLAWTVSEVFSALMIFPNLIALILLSKKVRELTNDYLKNHETGDYKIKPFYKK